MKNLDRIVLAAIVAIAAVALLIAALTESPSLAAAMLAIGLAMINSESTLCQVLVLSICGPKLVGRGAGIMTGTGLASMIAQTFVVIASPVTLPLWSYLSSLIITLLVPSAGGHWAVQGPFVLPAALSLHASVPRTAMGVAMAENVSNMLQPFWAVPIVAIAGIRIQRVMGYTAVTFVVSLVIYALALWLI